MYSFPRCVLPSSAKIFLIFSPSSLFTLQRHFPCQFPLNRPSVPVWFQHESYLRRRQPVLMERLYFVPLSFRQLLPPPLLFCAILFLTHFASLQSLLSFNLSLTGSALKWVPFFRFGQFILQLTKFTINLHSFQKEPVSGRRGGKRVAIPKARGGKGQGKTEWVVTRPNFVIFPSRACRFVVSICPRKVWICHAFYNTSRATAFKLKGGGKKGNRYPNRRCFVFCVGRLF